jgi:parallel beta-helix repeat protein
LDNSRIDVSNSQYVTITDCIISENNIGIYATGSSNLLIINNTFSNNKKSIYATVECGNMFIAGNKFSLYDDNEFGMYLQAKGKYFIYNNTINSHTDFTQFSCGIYIDGSSTIESNIVSNCNIGLWMTDGIHNIRKNTLRHNKQLAAYVFYSDILMEHNTIEKNGNNFITYQNQIEPGGVIIHSSKKEHCEIRNNKIESNRGYGIYLDGSLGFENKITNNDFIQNSIQAFFVNTRCLWYNNYWERETSLPKFIFGFIELNNRVKIPMFHLDTAPSVEMNV